MGTDAGYELHSFLAGRRPGAELDNGFALDDLPWREADRPTAQVLALQPQHEAAPGEFEELLVGVDPGTGYPRCVGRQQEALASFRVFQRGAGTVLGMITAQEGVLVNGLPALRFSALRPRDALVLSPGVHTYITQRVRPYVGPPTDQMLGKRCPFCRIPIAKGTRVLTHRCGVIYHYETQESHPGVQASERLNCCEQLRACLSCQRPISFEETLVWDPESI